ncbi:unnamed protein product [Durusdinium trenchii]|uniref:SH3b domain-containing protein n=1 Tax=Durusdinium trenchii TaxID=1381693 RepID=A0ABP0R418_9DINO
MARWRVVGGQEKGLIVRSSAEVSSQQLGRLNYGAEVEELQLLGERLEFQKVSGDGVERGWVSRSIPEWCGVTPGPVPELLTPCGWQHLRGCSIGPFHAHEEKVTTVAFDPVTPLQLWTASWSSASVRHWQLARHQQPQLVNQLKTHGLVSALQRLDQDTLLTAISANPMPAGNVCHQADFKQRMAELDDKLEPGQQLVLWRLDPRPEMWKQLPFHPHGCRLLAVGPGNELVASASKERLVLSHRSGPGAPLEVLWSVHLEQKLTALCFTETGSLWSCNGQHVTCWEEGRTKSSVEIQVDNVSALVALQDELLIAHETGFLFLDVGTGQIRQQYTKDVVSAAARLGQSFVAALGAHVVRYDVVRGLGPSPAKASGMWTLPQKVVSLHCLGAVGAPPLVAAGAADGTVVVFDAT